MIGRHKATRKRTGSREEEMKGHDVGMTGKQKERKKECRKQGSRNKRRQGRRVAGNARNV